MSDRATDLFHRAMMTSRMPGFFIVKTATWAWDSRKKQIFLFGRSAADLLQDIQEMTV
jgi:hypothetical protein